MITIEEKNYLIDSCFGSGYIIDYKYIKEYNNFYFCIEPSKMILFNYPKDDNNQLETEKIYNKKNIMNEKDFYEEIENLKNNGLNKINNDEYPKCSESLSISHLEKFFIEQSEKLNEIEKSFLIYNWIALNISLDLIENKNEEKLEDIIKKGRCSNVNFAKLYKYLGEKLNLKIQCIEGYSKLLDEIENIPNTFNINHLYNIINIDGKNYLIDSCFGSGHIIDSK